MKLSLARVLEIEAALKEFNELSLPAAISYKFARLARQIREITTPFYEERTKMFKQWGEEKGEMMVIKPEHQEQYQKEINALLDTEVEIDFKTIDISQLGNLNIKPNLLLALSDLINEPQN